MTSIRTSAIADEVLLDAARACLLAVGLRRTTMTDVARRAGVSRMTVYRRWPDMNALMGDLMTRELTQQTGVLASEDHDGPAEIARAVTSAVLSIRGNPLFRKVVEVDPELLLPYLLVRRGRTQEVFLDRLRQTLTQAQERGRLEAGDPELMARSILLTAHGFALSAQTMAEDDDLDRLFDQLTALLEGYLR